MDGSTMRKLSHWSTVGEIKCDYCGNIHNRGMDPDDEENPLEGDSVTIYQFGPFMIAECCFEKFENLILSDSNLILSILKDRQKEMSETAEKLGKALQRLK